MSFKAEFIGSKWNINPPASREDHLNFLAGFHEHGHAAITNMSSIGGIILFYHTMSVWAKEGKERYHRLWAELVSLSREAHEAFATSYSVLLFEDYFPNLMEELPEEYRRFHATWNLNS